MTYIAPLFIQSHWSVNAKKLTVLVLCFIAAGIDIWIRNGPITFSNLLFSGIAISATAVGFYHLFAKRLGADALEASTNISRGKDDVE